jgi:hypothetical protein
LDFSSTKNSNFAREIPLNILIQFGFNHVCCLKADIFYMFQKSKMATTPGIVFNNGYYGTMNKSFFLDATNMIKPNCA